MGLTKIFYLNKQESTDKINCFLRYVKEKVNVEQKTILRFDDVSSYFTLA